MSLSAGILKLGPIVAANPRVEAKLDASLDLARLTVATRLALTGSTAGLKFWSGPPPTATATVEDALGAPKRHLDVAALSAGLATQAIARESERIASLEADIRERAFFNRRLKGERLLDRRAAEVQDWQVEQERLKGLAEHLADQRAEEARLAAEKAAAEKGCGGAGRSRERLGRKPRDAARKRRRPRRSRRTNKSGKRPKATPRAETPGGLIARASGRQTVGPTTLAASETQAATALPTARRAQNPAEGCFPGALTEPPGATSSRRPGPALDASSRARTPGNAEDRSASPREASTMRRRPLSDSPRSSAMALKPPPERVLERDAGSMAGDDQRAFDDARVRSVSRHRALKPPGVEARLGERASLSMRRFSAFDRPNRARFWAASAWLALAFLLLSRPAQIDDLGHQSSLGYFLRKASIDTTLSAPAGSAGFSGVLSRLRVGAGPAAVWPARALPEQGSAGPFSSDAGQPRDGRLRNARLKLEAERHRRIGEAGDRIERHDHAPACGRNSN